MQKFGNLDKWRLVAKGAAITFQKTVTVRVRVSTPTDTDWRFLVPPRRVPTYLTTTNGHEVLEFVAVKGMKLIPSKDVRYDMAEGHDIHIEDDGPSFTKVANRQARNPEVEKIAYQAAQNVLRRANLNHAEEMRRKDQELEEARNAKAQADAAAGTDASAGAGVPPSEEADTAGVPEGEGGSVRSDATEKAAGGELPDGDEAAGR